MTESKLPVSPSGFVQVIFSKTIKWKLLVNIGSLASGQMFYIFLPAVLGLLINNIFTKGNWNSFWLFVFPVVWGVSYIFMAVAKFFTSAVTQDVRRLSKEIIFSYLIGLSSSVYTSKGAGEIESLTQEASFSVRYLFAESFPFFIRMFTAAVASGAILTYSSIWLGMLFIGWLVLYLPISYIVAKKAVKHVAASLISSAEVSSSMVDVIENHELIPSFGTEQEEISRFQRFLDAEWLAYTKAQFGIDKADLWQHFLQLLLPFSMVIFIVLAREKLTLLPGDVMALLMIGLLITAQMRDLGRGVLAFFEIKERMKTALSKLSTFQQVFQAVNRNSKIPVSYKIALDHVSFIYDTGHIALRDVTVSIKENEKIGIVGCSGAGKSTLVKILRGVYAPTSGTAALGGVLLTDVLPKHLSETISEVSQTIPLFHRSIRENVAYGCGKITDSIIWEMLERAQLAHYVRQLPNGLDTIIGVKGSKLSGGERARLAIARAFLKDSKIIILDEATASLDAESEMLVHKGIKALMLDRTVIIIAHRLTTLRSVERILMFEKGQLIADGSHDELLQSHLAYKQLQNLQLR